VVLDGRITGFRGNDQTNLPLAGASIEIYETSRRRASAWRRGAHEDRRRGRPLGTVQAKPACSTSS
jgi:hypothetical protein